MGFFNFLGAAGREWTSSTIEKEVVSAISQHKLSTNKHKNVGKLWITRY